MKAKFCVTFGELSIYLLYPFLIPIVRNLRYFILNHIKISQKMNHFNFLLYFFLCLAKTIFGLIGMIILKYSTVKEKDEVQIITIHALTPIQSHNPTRVSFSSMILILCLSILDLISSNVPSIVVQENDQMDITSFRYQLKIVVIFFYAFLCYYILSYPLYIHHICSLIFIAIGFCLIVYQSIQDMNGLAWYWIIVLVSCYLLTGIQNTYEKKIMEYKFVSLYTLLFYEGVFGIFLTVIMETVLYTTPCPVGWECIDENSIENVKYFFINHDIYVGIYVLMYMFFLGTIYLLFLLTIKYFTPTHLAVSDVFASFFYWGLEFYYKKALFDWSKLHLYGYVIVVIGGLVYNEIIILHCCKLGKNTKAKIKSRSDIDYRMIESVNTSLL